jgi:hypothetical protein
MATPLTISLSINGGQPQPISLSMITSRCCMSFGTSSVSTGLSTAAGPPNATLV